MSKRRGLAGESLGVNLSLIITPMLDMAFQLMAFFIMTFQPLSEEKNITGRLLPPVKEEQKKKEKKQVVLAPGKKKADENDLNKLKDKKKEDEKKDDDDMPPDDPPVVKDVVRVIVESKTPNDTNPSKIGIDPGRILLKFPESTEPEVIADLGDSFEAGLTRMTKKLTAWSNREGTKLEIVVHPDLKYQYFIQLQDACRGAKFKEMGFPKPTRPKKPG